MFIFPVKVIDIEYPVSQICINTEIVHAVSLLHKKFTSYVDFCQIISMVIHTHHCFCILMTTELLSIDKIVILATFHVSTDLSSKNDPQPNNQILPF